MHNEGTHNEEIHKHIVWTYILLRAGMATIAFLLPLALWWGGYLFSQELMTSMSAYYHSPMRNLFVGALCAIGAFLFLYRGFSQAENWVLNVAGLCAVGIAWFPTKFPASVQELCPDGATLAVCQNARFPLLHAVCALGFFACLFYVARWTAGDTLDELPESKADKWYGRREFYEGWYRYLSYAMIVFPIAAVVVLVLTNHGSYWVFWIELVAIWVFSAYWVLKTIEIQMSECDETMMRGKRPSVLHIESHAAHEATAYAHSTGMKTDSGGEEP